MRKLSLLILIVLLSGTLCWGAKHSDDFVLGTYTNMRNTFAFHRANREILSGYLQELGYNSTFMETDSAEDDLATLFGILDDHGVDAWLWDRSWSNHTQDLRRYAVGTLSSGNYLRLEAEFVDEREVKPGDSYESAYWYASRNEESLPRIGRAVSDPQASYGYSWYVDSSMNPGYAYTDLKYRWINKWGNYSRYGSSWFLYQTNPPDFDNQYVWVRYRFKIGGIQPNLDPDTPLLSFSAEGYPLVRSSYARETLALQHSNTLGRNSLSSQSTLRLAELKTRSDESGFITVELKVPYKELLDTGLMTMDLDNNPSTSPSATVMKLININPRLFWHGNCDLWLDYVELEDQVHYDFRTNQQMYKQGIVNRWNQLKGLSRGNIAALYSYDEPDQSKLDSFRMLEEALEDTDIGMVTAVYDNLYQQMVIDEDLGLYYDHLLHFRNACQPRNLAPDIYPIEPDTQWNSPNEDLFIQKLFDEKLHEAYLGSKLYSKNSFGIKFIPIIQSFGRWARIGDREQWTKWVLPPYATQKALNYIPLCYGVDGVYHYRFQSYQDSQGFGDHSAMTVVRRGTEYGTPTKNPVTWRALEDSNSKLMLYGSILRRYSWLGTQTLMETNDSLLNGLELAGISEIEINSTDNEPYKGYVQMALYEDESEAITLFMVNRRANYFEAGNYEAAKFVAQEDYQTSFPQASPQSVIIRADEDILQQYGNHAALYDPAQQKYYEFENGQVSIILEAGEAILLHLVGHIPNGMSGRNSISSFAELRGQCSLQDRARLSVEEGATLILMPEASLNIPPRAKLIVKGELVLMPGASLEPRSRVDFRRNSILTDFNQPVHY